MTKKVRITRNFEYFRGAISGGYQELILDKDEWEKYGGEERFNQDSYIVGDIDPYDVDEHIIGENEIEVEEFEDK